jgi:hypothetical protein
VLSCIHFIVATSAVGVGHIEVSADRVCSFLKSVAVVELDSPALFPESALNVVSAFFLTVATSIDFGDAASETKHW